MSSHKTDLILYWIPVACSVLPFISHGKQSEGKFLRLRKISINLNKLLAVLLLPVYLFIRLFLFCTLLLSVYFLIPYFSILMLLMFVYFFIFVFILILLLYFCFFVDHVNKLIVFIIWVFVYHFKNTICILLTLYLEHLSPFCNWMFEIERNSFDLNWALLVLQY